MAKDSGIEKDMFKRTEPQQQQPGDNSDLDTGVIKSIGVGLKEGEVNAIQAMADSIPVKRNALMRFAIRWFIKQARAGNVDLTEFTDEPPPPEKRLRMP
jgi:hypothetical protein